jgi:hypothetical protein
VALQVGSFVEYRCKADPEKQLVSEDGVVSGTLDNRCWLRTGQAMMQSGSCIYVFGGVVQRDGTKTNDVNFFASTLVSVLLIFPWQVSAQLKNDPLVPAKKETLVQA